MSRKESKAAAQAALNEAFRNLAWGQKLIHITDDEGVTHDGRIIALPLSPSDDRRLQPTKQGRLCNTTMYNGWLLRARTALRKYRLVPYPKEVPLYVYTLVVMPNHRSDHHNYQKALYDSMEKCGCVLTNDRQITERHTRGIVIKDEAFTISIVVPAHPNLVKRVLVTDELLAQELKEIEDGREALSTKHISVD